MADLLIFSSIFLLLSALLSQYSLEDVGVHDRPLEEAIAEMFTATRSAAVEPAEAGVNH